MDGVLAVSSTGGDPHFETPTSGLAGGHAVVLRYRAQEDFTLQLFWADTTGGFADSRHIDYPIPAAVGQWREITLPFACLGDLNSLRLDPNTSEAHPLEIDSIVLRRIEPAEIETLTAEGALTVLAATSLSLQVAAFQAWFGQKEEFAATGQRILAAGEVAAENFVESGTSAFYQAMSLFRQGKKDEARKLASATAAKMKPLPADDQNPLAQANQTVGGVSQEDLILWLAHKEAKALIQFDAPTPSPSPLQAEDSTN